MMESSGTPRILDNGPEHEAGGELLGCRILLAEDCPDQQRLFARSLQRAGAKITLECNGRAAVAAVERNDRAFDAIIMDFEMPVMDGVEATNQLRFHGFQGLIVAISAHSSDIDENKWLSVGADVFLRKPVCFPSLIATLRQLTWPPSSGSAWSRGQRCHE